MEQEVECNKPEDLSKEAKELSEVLKELEYFSDTMNKKLHESSVKQRKKEKTNKNFTLKEDPLLKILQMLQKERESEKQKENPMLQNEKEREDTASKMLQMLQNEKKIEKKFAEITNDSEFFNYILDLKIGIKRPKLTESEKIFVNSKMFQILQKEKESEEQREKDKTEKDPASKMLQLKK